MRSESSASTRSAVKLNGPQLAHPHFRIPRQCYQASSVCDQISTIEDRYLGILSVAVPYLWPAPVSREKREGPTTFPNPLDRRYPGDEGEDGESTPGAGYADNASVLGGAAGPAGRKGRPDLALGPTPPGPKSNIQHCPCSLYS
jgi:hypothetical protein